jgi:hypothetical protein
MRGRLSPSIEGPTARAAWIRKSGEVDEAEAYHPLR